MVFMEKLLNSNVLFNLAGFIIGCFVVYKLPRRIPLSVSALIMVMSLAIALGLDHTIGVFPFDLYDTNIKPWLTFSEIPTWGMYPIFGYIFIYLIEKLNVRGLYIPLYLLLGSLFGMVFEKLANHFNVFQYKHWSLRYSFVVYLFTQLLTFIVYKLLMNHSRKHLDEMKITNPNS
jgi:hypothetical protein